MTNTELTLKYFVATRFGITRLQKFLDTNGLGNIDISVPEPHIIENLTEAGMTAIKDGTFFLPGKRYCPADPASHLIRLAFANLKVWKTPERVTRAVKFCEHVGLQLFRQYLAWKAYPWQEERIVSCALGMCGLGLCLAYSHSVPKASLPLFWADGEVVSGHKTNHWQPLFAEAKY